MMMTFGHATLTDLLSWVLVLNLALKLLVTLILLPVDKEIWDRPGWGAWLWWTSKITPIIAVPCAIWLAWLHGLTAQVWLFAGLMLFVVVAVPIKIRQRRSRIANRKWSA